MFPDWKRLSVFNWVSDVIWTVLIAMDMAAQRWGMSLIDAAFFLLLIGHWAKDQQIEDLKAQVPAHSKTQSDDDQTIHL